MSIKRNALLKYSLIGYRAINKFRYFYKEYKDKEFNLLDVGCGNHSPSLTKFYFPKVNYYGIDKDLYNIDDEDLKNMKEFYKKDLEKDTLEDIPNNFFDVVIMSHIIEHLRNGLFVVEEISKKVKVGGYYTLNIPQ